MSIGQWQLAAGKPGRAVASAEQASGGVHLETVWDHVPVLYCSVRLGFVLCLAMCAVFCHGGGVWSSRLRVGGHV